MTCRYLLVASLLVPTAANAQRTCGIMPVSDKDSGARVYATCATDLPARLLTPPQFSTAFQSGWSGTIDAWMGIPILLEVDTNGTPQHVLMPGARRLDPARREALMRSVLGWHFRPARRDDVPVSVADSVIIYPTPRARHRPPPTCLDCDPRRATTRWKVSTTPPDRTHCDTALAILASGRIAERDDWIYPLAPHCPGAGPALASFVRMLHPLRRAEVSGRLSLALFATIRRPEVLTALMRSARGGERQAFHFLALQSGFGYSRVADSIPGRWDFAHNRPASSCGPMKIYLISTDLPAAPPDPSIVARIQALADSIAKAPRIRPDIRTSAWCLSAQLR